MGKEQQKGLFMGFCVVVKPIPFCLGSDLIEASFVRRVCARACVCVCVRARVCVRVCGSVRC